MDLLPIQSRKYNVDRSKIKEEKRKEDKFRYALKNLFFLILILINFLFLWLFNLF